MEQTNQSIEEKNTQKNSTNMLKRVGGYLAPYKSGFLKLLFAILVSNIVLVLGPYFTSIVIDESIPNKDTTQLIWIIVLFSAAQLFGGWSSRYRIKNITLLGQDVLKDMRTDVFVHLQKLPFSFFDSRPHGKIVTRVVNYINSLSDLLSNGLINVLSDVFSLVVTLIIMFAMDVRLTLYSFILLPVLFVVTLVIQREQRKAYEEVSSKQAELNAYIHESVAGIKVTQSYTRENVNKDIFAEVSEGQRTTWMHAVKIQFLLAPFIQNIATITISIIYFIGLSGFGVDVSTGVLIAFIGYVNNFWNPMINIGNFYNSLVTGMVYLERIFEILDIEPEIQDAPNAFVMPPIQGYVVFNDVKFGYKKDQPIFEHLSFRVRSGETIALVGPTGAGKSTIINLMTRFYDVDDGEILVDGIDIRKVTLNSLRNEIGVMLQETFIFSGTIMENIRLGKLDATEEEIIQAAKIVRAHDFIISLKDGYRTVVKERGSTLSAGQRQLISFARTLLADPKVLILDEATSSIDTQTEILLQEGLDRLLEGRTAFIIAHRLSTIKNSSRIFYIADKKIQESGSHNELMAQKGLYYNLYSTQAELLKKM
ncbi:MAG: ABC transporter ATP-binding protein [Carnobacterium inhibens]|uniref:ATP-binding cassette domain-containing protein n=1 Tax=Carnobacterium inhibens TaxID=147709 RepID=A0ABR7T8J4_9LACT|nr:MULTISPECIES: ABC transporter ATP-binding protein [Carnobacterium]MBC9824403.1 ATP-binding cassette domain-containing protein [Carnobacterium inhibens]MDN5372077.1 ATP-binding cassette, subfamily multidrug efflux pump [Carnobacterium sp.]